MEKYQLKIKKRVCVLALGAESSGNFSIYLPTSKSSLLTKGRIKKGSGNLYLSEDFGDLLEHANFNEYKNEVNEFIKKNGFRPDIILCDLHPDFKTTVFAHELANKYKAEVIPVQHHIAHIFSAIGDRILQDTRYKIQDTNIGIACDGTGLGLDGKIWGGEVFKISNFKFLISNKNSASQISNLKAERVGHLENQILLGGEIAIKEPARMLIPILAKFLPKNEVFFHVKKYYSKNEFELLWNQNQQKFNCLETSSTARILDAVSVLLGFSKNTREEKHGPIKLLEENSTIPYNNLKIKIERYKIPASTRGDDRSSTRGGQDTRYKQISKINPPNSMQKSNEMLILNTTYLFEYLVKNLHKDKKRLAATAQAYIANGLVEICQISNLKSQIYFAGGMANNKIISSYLEKQNIYTSKTVPRGDAGLSAGQLFYYLLANPRD